MAYVPPHLRNGGGDRPSNDNHHEPRRNDDRRQGGGYEERRGREGHDDRRGGGGGYQGREDRGQDRGQDRSQDRQTSTNSRWSNFDRGGDRGGGDRGGGGYGGDRGGGGYGGGGGRGGASKRNALGFHGDTRPNSRLEKELFGECVSSGINFAKYDDIPVETSGDNIPEHVTEFRAEELGKEVLANLDLCKYTVPTPVQKYSIPIGLAGRDMMACAQTGSGKTGGFLFPCLAMMLRQGGPDVPEDNGRRPKIFPVSLILAPTRELASQIYEEARKFCYCTGIASVVIYGGAEVGQQLRQLERGCDILVATPGRLVDLIERGRISLAAIQFLILDEADRMLDMGFEPQIRRIVEQEDMCRERQTFMFSATFPKEIQRLAADFLRDYIFLTVGRVGSASKDVKQEIQFVEQHDKVDYVIQYLNTVQEGLILIFVETKRGADSLEMTLSREGFPATSIHGDRSQREREDALRSFKTGRTPVLVATDVAARGLDINGVTQVINFDLPSNVDDYVHRIGRTGRVGNIGHAMSMMNDKNRNIARELYELMVENGQECPPFLAEMCQSANRGGGGRGGRGGRGGSRYGARDFRRDRNDRPQESGGGGGFNRPSGQDRGGGSGWRGGGGGGHSEDNSSW